MARSVKPKLFRCPKCGSEQRTIGSEVQHRCRVTRSIVRYELVEEDTPET